MATVFSPSAALFSSAAASLSSNSPKSLSKPPNPPSLPCKSLSSALTAAAAAVILSTSPVSLADDTSPFSIYYGTAASAANYGGYGGNSSKKDSAEYTYEVPDGWKERLVSKVEKGTNGTDSEFYNPKKRSEKEYLTFLSGFRSLAPVETVLNNLALSDVDLQDLIASADSVRSSERRSESGQIYYVYEIQGNGGAHSLISVTCARNKLFAHFVNAPKSEWDRDEQILRHIHESFTTI